MSKTRMVNTRFWNDGFVSHLDPIEKLLFIYFITNEHTNICGIYELPLKIAAIETGIDASMFEKVLPRLSEKIVYIDGWVVIKNFTKHQSGGLPKVKRGIELALDSIPQDVYEKAVAMGYRAEYNRKTIGNQLGIDTHAMYSDSDSDSDSEDTDGKPSDTPEEGEEPTTFEEFMSSKGYSQDSIVDEDTTSVWWEDENGRKLKQSEVNKLKTSFEAHLRGKKAAKTQKANLAKRSTFSYAESLEALRVSSRKEEKVLALVWFRKNYDLKSYDQYKGQYARDIKYAKELVGYSASEIDEAIDMAEAEGQRLGYEWGMSTVAKKILHVAK